MKQTSGRATRILVVVLTVIALISGGVTAFLVLNQMVPDIQAGVPGGSGTWQPYREEWEASLGLDGQIQVDLSSVDVEVIPWEGNTIQAAFEGSVSPYGDGTLPKITAHTDDASFRLSMEQTSGLTVGIGISHRGRITGTLTVQVPKTIAYRLNVDLFSGNVLIRDWEAAELTAITSSGAIVVERVASKGNTRLETFSGNMTIQGFSAGDCVVDTSSGGITAGDMTCASLQWDQFSGNMTATNLNVAGSCVLSSSSGNIHLEGVRASSLRADTFSGSIAVAGGVVEKSLAADTSSGRVELSGCAAEEVSLTTFSGNILVPELTAEKLTVDTSSGKVTGALTHPASLDCLTFSGDVELMLPKESQFTLSADTFSGRMEVGFPLTIQGDASAKSLSGQVGEGTHSVRVETSSGNIVLRSR